jgi:pyridoxine kinase
MEATHFQDILEGLVKNGFVYSHLVTGYIGTPTTLEAIRAVAKELKERQGTMIIVDPVLGDHGRWYVDQGCLPLYREFLSMAEVVTPNGTEAE